MAMEWFVGGQSPDASVSSGGVEGSSGRQAAVVTPVTLDELVQSVEEAVGLARARARARAAVVAGNGSGVGGGEGRNRELDFLVL